VKLVTKVLERNKNGGKPIKVGKKETPQRSQKDRGPDKRDWGADRGFTAEPPGRLFGKRVAKRAEGGQAASETMTDEG